MDDDEIALRETLLRAAGCRCDIPLLGERPGKGPRCRTCNTEAVWPMTPAAFRAAVERLGWSYRGLADMVQIDERQVRRWAAGNAIPPHIAAWIERAVAELAPLQDAAAAWLQNNPPPARKPVDVSARRGL